MPEMYSREELAAMDGHEYAAAAANGFNRPEALKVPFRDSGNRPSVNLELDPELGPATQKSPPSSPPQDPYDWSGTTEHEFTVPSGRKCLLKNADVKELAAAGILDKVTRLQGLADKLVKQSQGEPPEKEGDMGKSILQLEEVLDKLVPLVVIKPRLSPAVPMEERLKGRVYIDTVDFVDKVAIANHVLGALAKFDNFRQ